MPDAMRRQWLWALAFYIRKMKGVGDSRLRTYIKLSRR